MQLFEIYFASCYNYCTYWHLWQTYLPRPCALSLALHSWQRARPPFLIKPKSASSMWHCSHRKQPGCQFWFIALMTLPMTNSPHFPQHGANSTWKSCSQYLRSSNSKNVPSLNTWKHCAHLKMNMIYYINVKMFWSFLHCMFIH